MSIICDRLSSYINQHTSCNLTIAGKNITYEILVDFGDSDKRLVYTNNFVIIYKKYMSEGNFRINASLTNNYVSSLTNITGINRAI